MYHDELVKFCSDLVDNSIKNRTQIRTHFGKKESSVFNEFKIIANRYNYDYQAETMPFNELVYTISKNGKIHKCYCGNSTLFLSVSRGYSMYCCDQCKKNDPSYKNKMQQTQKSKSATEKLAIEEKRKATHLEKYGVEYAMHSDTLVEKFKDARSKK